MDEKILSTQSVWNISKQVAHLAYVYKRQNEGPENKREADIEITFRKILNLLDEQRQKYQKTISPIFKVRAVNELAELFAYIANDGLTEDQAKSPSLNFQIYKNTSNLTKPLDDEGLKLAIWKTLTSPGSPEYHDYDLALDYQLPTKEEINEGGGPKDYARWYWGDRGGVCGTTIRNFKKKIERGDIKISVARYFLPYAERIGLIESICFEQLELKVHELRPLAQTFIDIADQIDNENLSPD